MNQPRVSVILATHNDASYLPETLDSILQQTFADFELIVVNDGSSDNTQAILNRCTDRRLIVVSNDQNLGLTRSLNKALRLAQGDLIARHDADDVSEPDRFQLQAAYMESHPGIGFLGTGYHVISEAGQVLDTVQLPTDDARLRERLAAGNVFCHGTVMLRRASLEQAGGYREQFPVAQDYDLWLRIAEQDQLGCLAPPLYRFRIHQKSISRQRRALQLAYARLAQELARQRKTDGHEAPVPEDVLRAFPPEPGQLARDLRNNAYLYYASGETDSADACLKQAEAIKSPKAKAGWDGWSLDRAHQLAHLRGDRAAGAAFITWVFESLSQPETEPLKARTLGRYWAEQAFSAHDLQGPETSVIGAAWRAIRCDPRWLRNRGLWAISVRSSRKRR